MSRFAGDDTWVEPRLATATERRFSDPDWLFERKLDGVRTLAVRTGGGTRLVSRNRNDVTASYPEIAAALDDVLDTDDVVLDGEIVAFDADDRTSFARLQQRIHLTGAHRIAAVGVPVFFHAFDLLRWDAMTRRPYPCATARRSCATPSRGATRCASPSTSRAAAKSSSNARAAATGRAWSPSGPRAATSPAAPATG